MPVLELDYFEYANDGQAQASYPSSEVYTAESKEEYYEGSADVVNRGVFGHIGGSGAQEKLAQEFQVSKRLYVTKVEAYMWRDGPVGDNLICRIEADSGGYPSGNLVNANAIKSIAAGGISSSIDWVIFTFPAGFWLEPGTIYHKAFERDGTRDSDKRINWVLDNTDPTYANGNTESRDSGFWSNDVDSVTGDFLFRIYGKYESLQCYSEDTIKQQGSYSLKGIAKQAYSLNEYLERTIGTPIDLSNCDTIKFDIRASRTGSNIKIGIRDSGGVWTEITPNIASADTWQNIEWDISGVAGADKDAIDRIKITIVNADADNTLYIDNLYAEAVGGVAIISGGGALVGAGEKGGIGSAVISGAGALAAEGKPTFFRFEKNLIKTFEYVENIDELRNRIIIEGEEYSESDKFFETASAATTLDDAITDRHIAKYNCRVCNSNPISIPNQTWTALTFDSEVWDVADMHSNSVNPSRLTCKKEGYYFTFASVQFATNATGHRGLQIIKNGLTSHVREYANAVSGAITSISLMTIIQLFENDYVELWAWQTSGGALNVNASYPETPSFGAVKQIQ